MKIDESGLPFREGGIWLDDTNQRRLRVREILIDERDRPAAVLFDVMSGRGQYHGITEIGFNTLRKMKLRQVGGRG